MDISICFADFPTQKIGETTRAFRQLGIGYANLGALLMATGHAYDSDGGRALAGAITSLMTGTSYRRSAELAARRRPVRRLRPQRRRPPARHAAARRRQRRRAVRVDDLDTPVWAAATEAWQDVLRLGEKNGYRNAQACVLAPTGTIGLMMDCDTTGVEPDLALVKFKKLVGGGSMQIVNDTVPQALKRLGYQDEQIEAIVAHIAEHGNVVDAPGLKPEHYEVFDCAMGERADLPDGPRADDGRRSSRSSPARITKTVNMPETATVEEIEEIYLQGWKMGIKALAIYRDNCKVGQPLSATKKKEKSRQRVEAAEATAAAPVEKVVEYRPVRKRLPKGRPGITTSFTVGGAEGYMTANSYPDDGLGEVFLKMSKQGSTLAGMMDAFSIAVSVGLQYGVPLETYVSKFTNMRFEPAGHDRRPGRADGAVDRRLHLPPPGAGLPALRDPLRPRHPLRRGAPAPPGDRLLRAGAARTWTSRAWPSRRPGAAGPDSARRRAAGPEVAAAPAPKQAHTATELMEIQLGLNADAPLCFSCGTKMRRAGSCYVCEGCGSTSGCS